jgi:hypothetical protein
LAEVENIYQMFTRLGRAGFFVKRNSWSHPRTVAQVLTVGGLLEGVLPGKPPYYQDASRKNPVVIARISYQGQLPIEEELTSPGTYAYSIVPRPDSWPHRD